MSTGYSFRIRVERSPTDTLEVAESELSLVEVSEAHRISLKNKTAEQPLKEAQHFVLMGTGYLTEEEARSAGESYEAVLMVALARVRVGVDFGYRAAKGSFTTEGLKWLEQQHGQRMLNDMHGLMVYTVEPKPLFALSTAKMLRGASKDRSLRHSRQQRWLSRRSMTAGAWRSVSSTPRSSSPRQTADFSCS